MDTTISWAKITDRQFEELVCNYLRVNGFTNIVWHGKGGSDRGRDIVAEKRSQFLIGKEINDKWVVQCKHHPGTSGIKKSAILDDLAKAEAFRCTGWLLVTSGHLTSDQMDWLSGIRQKYTFQIQFCHRPNLEDFLEDYPKIARRFFGVEVSSLPEITPTEIEITILLAKASSFITAHHNTLRESLSSIGFQNLDASSLLAELPEEYALLRIYFSNRRIDEQIPKFIVNEFNEFIKRAYILDLIHSQELSADIHKRVVNINCLYYGAGPEIWEVDPDFKLLEENYSKLVPQSVKRAMKPIFQRIVVVSDTWLRGLTNAQVISFGRHLYRETNNGTEVYLANIDEVPDHIRYGVISRDMSIEECVNTYELTSENYPYSMLKGGDVTGTAKELLEEIDQVLSSGELIKISGFAKAAEISSLLNRLLADARIKRTSTAAPE
jgi:hypothetical protein